MFFRQTRKNEDDNLDKMFLKDPLPAK